VKDHQALLSTRVAAIFAIKQGLGPQATATLVPLMDEAPVREWVIRSLGDRLEEVAEVPVAPIIVGLEDTNPRVRLAAVIALARLGQSAATAPLTHRLDDPDPLVAHTAVNALVVLQAADACFAMLDRQDASAGQRVGALRVLQSLHTTRTVEGLIEAYDREGDGLRRRGIVSALCRLYFKDGPWKGESWGTRPDTSGPYYQPATWEESSHIAETLRTAVKREHGDDAAHLFTELNRHKIVLDGSLDTILAAAEKDSAIIPAAVGQLSRLDNVPDSALPLLVRAIGLEKADPIISMQSIVALVKLSTVEAWQAALSAIVKLEAAGRNKTEYERARDALLNSPKLELQLPLFTAVAEKAGGQQAIWADAALLQISTRGSVESRELATKALDEGWQHPLRRVQIIAAVEAARHNGSKARVLSAEHDADSKVVAAAKRAIKSLRWDQPSVKPEGPKIGTLDPAAVVEQVLKTKGSVAYGEELFARLNCAKCHTVKPYEPLRGPFLGNIAATYRRRDLAESVLLPSKSIAQGFATNQFLLDDGRSLTGFVTLEAADRVVIRDLEGKETTIPTASIEERAKQPLSMMPEGLVKELAVNEFASLVDYLESLVKKGQ
jgi:putative heme-binding domain-containing protein